MEVRGRLRRWSFAKKIAAISLLCLSFFSATASVKTDSVLPIKEARDFFPLNLACSLLKDNKGRLTLDDVLKPEAQFERMNQEIYDFNQDENVEVYWMKCAVQNLTHHDLRELFCLHPGLDSVTFFFFLPDGSLTRAGTYAGELTRAKPFFISRQITAPVVLQPGVTKIYCRIVNHSKRSQATSSIIASLADERLFVNYVLEYKLYQGVAIGMLVLIFVLHIFIYAFVRDATYLAFLINVLFTIIFLLLRKNYHLEFDFLAPVFRFIPEYHDIFGVLLSITAIWFTQTFLSTRTEDRVMHITMNVLMILQGVVVLSLATFQWITLMNQLTIYFGFLSAVVMVISSVRSYRRGNKLALYIFFGFILLAFVPIVYMVPVPNYLHYRNDESDWQYLGEAVRAIIFAVGIAHRIYLLNRQVANYEIEKKELALVKEQQLSDEKERISRDLHDNIGSELATLSMELWQLSKQHPQDEVISSALQTSGSIYNQLRDTIWAIEKKQVRMEDLESRLNVMLWKHEQSNSGIHLSLSSDMGDSPLSLTPVQGINLYRIIQEAVQNAVNHSACAHIKVNLHFNAERFELLAEVSDDGKGFSPSLQKDESDHYGLRNMKHRALEVQGKIDILSKPGQGTSVVLTFPLRSH